MTVEQLRAWSYRRQSLGRSSQAASDALRRTVGVHASHPTAPLALLARRRARIDARDGHDDAAKYWRGWAVGSFLTAKKGKGDDPGSKSTHRLALRARDWAEKDDEEGHSDAAEYWRGWAAGAFLTAEAVDFPHRYSSPAQGSSRTGVGTAPVEDPGEALPPPAKRRKLKTPRP